MDEVLQELEVSQAVSGTIEKVDDFFRHVQYNLRHGVLPAFATLTASEL